MSTVEVQWALSEASRKAAFVATGNLPAATHKLAIDASTLTSEERATLIAWLGPELKQVGFGGGRLTFDAAPTPAEFVARVAAMVAEDRARQVRDVTFRLQTLTTNLREAIATQRPRSFSDVASDIKAAAALGIDTTEIAALWAEHQANEGAWRQAREARDTAERLRQAAEKAAADERDAQRKAAFVAEHGSDHLKRAIAAGHSCDRLYWIERAAYEYPGCVLDYERAAEWRERTCPSIEALNVRDQLLAAHPAATVNVVWLTDEPRDRKAREDEYDAEPFEQGEAVVIGDPDYIRWLVRAL